MKNEQIYAVLQQAYFSDHPDEEDVLACLPALLQGVRHFVDIGASLGQFTFHASKVMLGGRLDAFEADPIRATKLRENCASWSADSGNTITAHHAAVARTDGKVTFHSTQSNVSGGLFSNSLTHLDADARAKVEWAEIEVPAVSLDEFYQDCAPPDFIKMDIEGAEGEALEGSVRILKAGSTRWLIELHNFDAGWSPGRVIDFMRTYRYGAKEVAPGRVLFTPMSRGERFAQRVRAIGGKVRRSLRW